VTYDADAVVIGLGALGSATAWQLARRGVSVIGLERFELGHLRGASHGDSRIIRLSYHTPAYVGNAQQAYQDWADLEADSGRSLVLRCGGIDVFPPRAAIPVDDYVNAMTARGVPFEVLDDDATRRRWPAITVPDGSTVVQQNETGIVPASLGTTTMREQATAHGARLVERCPVVELTADDDGVRARCADGSTVRARTAVVTADAWTNDVLAGLGVQVPLTVTKEHVVHFALDDAAVGTRAREQALATHSPGAFPVWIWMDDPSYYGFPSYGEASVKVGQDCGGRVVDPDTRDFEPDADYVAAMRDFVARTVPGAGGVSRVTTCLYTLTPDRDFVAALVPGRPRVAVGLGSAHGFKFAPWFGRVLADLATTGATTSDVAAFTLDRPALTDPSAPRHWLV
jgi:sarcosine oxidase